MSQIFEALQRAQAERTGDGAELSASAAELLEQVVDQRATKAAAEVTAAAENPLLKEIAVDFERELAGVKVVTPTPAVEARLVCLTDQGCLAAEKFRVLGLKLRNLREKRPLKRVVVTSTIPEEGKSLTAANLALNQSRSRILKTLLVDGDLRRPSLASKFGLSRSLPGLVDCLGGEKQVQEVLCKLEGTNLWFLPAGLPPENPLELMQSGRVPELLDRLGRYFDWVIIDCPPVMPLADTAYWMKLSDGVLLVVREGVAEKKPLARVLESIDRSQLLGVVVNSHTNGDHTSYYQRYGALSGHPSRSPEAGTE